MSSSTSAGSTPARGIRRGSSGFKSELTVYVHRRLRLLALWLFVIVGILYALDAWSIFFVFHGGWREFFSPTRMAILVDLVALGTWWIVLRRPSCSARALAGLDAALYVHSAGLAVLLFCAKYPEAEPMLHWLAAAIVTRAVLVPSRAGRTLWLGLAAMAAVFAVRLVYSAPTDVIPDLLGSAQVAPFTSLWWHAVIWREAELAAFVAIAVTASHVNFALRLKAYEAKQLDQYVLEGRIGQGAMGEVHRARHALMKRPVAIKFIRAELVGEAVVRRFEKEVQSTSLLTHPNTIAIYDYGQTHDGLFYYAMEHLEGADLERVVDRAGPLPASRVIHLLMQACGPLEEAHRRGFVHRDVKSGNLFLCETGLGGRRDVVKVMDFGLVKDVAAGAAALTQVGDVVGTPHTIAPECIRGRPATAASDIYALGAVGCFLLTGRPIFDATTAGEFISAHLNEQPVAPSARRADVPADVEAVLLRCLRKAPDDRWASVAELRDALGRCADAGGWTDANAALWWDANRAAFAPAAAP